MRPTKQGLLAAAAALALAAGSGAAFSQAEKTMPGQGGTQIETPGARDGSRTGGDNMQRPGQTGQTQDRGIDRPGQAQQRMPDRERDADRPGQAQERLQDRDRDADRPGQAQQRDRDQRGGADAARGGDAQDRPAQLSEEQRNRISTTVRGQTNLRRVERNAINFNINIGAVVPRTVSLAPLPAPLLTVVPAYRGYLYVVVDDELLIIHPRTYEIVAIIPA